MNQQTLAKALHFPSNRKDKQDTICDIRNALPNYAIPRQVWSREKDSNLQSILPNYQCSN